MVEGEPVPATVEQARRDEDEALLSQFLSGRDAPCPTCGYNLRDLAGDRCPECGDALALTVNVTESRLASLITGLVGLSAGTGLNGLLLVYGLIELALREMSRGDLVKFMTTNAAGFLIEGAALLVWLRRWRQLRRLSPGRRRAWAVAAWSLTLANLICFSFVLR